MITIGSLFSGIGGLELGVLAAFAERGIPARVVWQVEIDPFCRAVLARHFPDTDRSVIDVRAASSLRTVDLIVGGFPCQDVSGAGKGEGLSGERSGLWWAYRDGVRALRPDAVLVENVASGLPRWHGPVRCSLETMGYRTRARQIGAHDVGAPHRRERVFVLAYANSHGREGERSGGLFDSERATCGHDVDRCGHPVANASGERRDEGERREFEAGCPPARVACSASGRVGDAQSGMGGDAHGLPAGLDLPSRWPAGRGEEQHAWEPSRTATAREPHRRSRLKALGNAVVPAQGREAMRWALDVLGWQHPLHITPASPPATTSTQENPR